MRKEASGFSGASRYVCILVSLDIQATQLSTGLAAFTITSRLSTVFLPLLSSILKEKEVSYALY